METNVKHICPWYMAWALIIPLRKLVHNPLSILSEHIKPGMKVMDYGCAIGYFTLPMARMVGEAGKVYAVDIQPEMLDWLKKRTDKAGLGYRVVPVLIQPVVDFEELKQQIDFVLLFAMVHEVVNQNELFEVLSKVVKPGGKMLFAEPKGHVTINDFEKSISLALKHGFFVKGMQRIRTCHAVVLEKR